VGKYHYEKKLHICFQSQARVGIAQGGEISLSQLSSEHKVHPNQLRNWRDLALTDFASLVGEPRQPLLPEGGAE
jgi:transposase-like protein